MGPQRLGCCALVCWIGLPGSQLGQQFIAGLQHFANLDRVHAAVGAPPLTMSRIGEYGALNGDVLVSVGPALV